MLVLTFILSVSIGFAGPGLTQTPLPAKPVAVFSTIDLDGRLVSLTTRYSDGTTQTKKVEVPANLISIVKLYDTNGNYVGSWYYYDDGTKVWHPFGGEPTITVWAKNLISIYEANHTKQCLKQSWSSTPLSPQNQASLLPTRFTWS